MKCVKCGAALSEGAPICSACGAEQKGPAASGKGGGVGYSARINDPAFKKYVKNTNRWAAIFSAVIAAIAVGAFYIMGETGYEGMKNPEALYQGLGVAGMFIVIGLFTVRGRNKSKTWDGVVTDRTAKRKQRTITYGKESRYEDYTEFSVEITAADGKKHYIKVDDNDTLYNYYKTGDRVRHHGGLKTYEKYDKSGDSAIFCNACMSRCSIDDDYCFRCKCPLLK
ncbi:MAG: zinc-ribbon domain-containing protein [Aminivibrio sp.]|jgi:hypothetical protein